MDWVLTVTHPELLYGDAAVSWNFIIPSVLHLILNFVLLGICASDYLCPNIAKLADDNGHGSGTLMPVLLAWCNSSPDVFSNFMSWMTPDIEGTSAVALSIGEVLGACGIVLCVVLGSIFTIMAPVKLQLTYAQRANFVRDLAFAILAVGLLFYICGRNEITLLNCITMMAIYVVYLIVKFKFRKFDGVLPSDNRELGASTLPAQSTIDEQGWPGRINPSLMSSMNLNGWLIAHPFKENIQTTAANLRMVHMPIAPRNSSVVFESCREPDSTQYEFSPSVTHMNKKSRFQKLRSWLLQIFFPNPLELNKKSIIEGLLSLLAAPFVVVLRLSCPKTFQILAVDNINGRYILHTKDVALLFVQSVICPPICIMTLSCVLGQTLSMGYWVGALIVSTGLLALMLTFYGAFTAHDKSYSLTSTPRDEETAIEHRRILEKLDNVITVVYLLLGITNTILWISLISNSLVEILELYQHLTQISRSILGLTIFAWGNSISDLISNVAMCRQYRNFPQEDSTDINKVATKYFMISCTSCIGGVMLNSMGGIGLSGLVTMLLVQEGDSKWSMKLDRSTALDFKFIISCIALAVQLALLLVIFSAPLSMHEWFKRRMKPLGISMCCMWGIATLFNVLLESV